MFLYILKVVVSVVLIVLISEISKRSTLIGGVLASIPLVSVLGIIWLYVETKNTAQVAKLSSDIFWLVIPSLSLFLVLPYLLKLKVPFAAALPIGLVVMGVCYYLTIWLMGRMGISA